MLWHSVGIFMSSGVSNEWGEINDYISPPKGWDKGKICLSTQSVMCTQIESVLVAVTQQHSCILFSLVCVSSRRRRREGVFSCHARRWEVSSWILYLYNTLPFITFGCMVWFPLPGSIIQLRSFMGLQLLACVGSGSRGTKLGPVLDRVFNAQFRQSPQSVSQPNLEAQVSPAQVPNLYLFPSPVC